MADNTLHTIPYYFSDHIFLFHSLSDFNPATW